MLAGKDDNNNIIMMAPCALFLTRLRARVYFVEGCITLLLNPSQDKTQPLSHLLSLCALVTHKHSTHYVQDPIPTNFVHLSRVTLSSTAASISPIRNPTHGTSLPWDRFTQDRSIPLSCLLYSWVSYRIVSYRARAVLLFIR